MQSLKDLTLAATEKSPVLSPLSQSNSQPSLSRIFSPSETKDTENKHSVPRFVKETERDQKDKEKRSLVDVQAKAYNSCTHLIPTNADCLVESKKISDKQLVWCTREDESVE